jgi:hypothetical protein
VTQPTHKIALVGHCRPDAFALRSALARFAQHAEFVDVTSEDDLQRHTGADAILINRVLDGDFQDDSGLRLLETLPAESRSRAALVSNLPDAQERAAALGAAPGFGKSEMYSERARASIEHLLGQTR